MAGHNEVESKYNPKSIMDETWEKFRFADIDVNALFWLQNNNYTDNHCYRKQTDTTAMNTKTREVHTFTADTVIYDRY